MSLNLHVYTSCIILKCSYDVGLTIIVVMKPENVVVVSKLALALAYTLAGGSDLSYQPYSSTLDHTVRCMATGSGGRIVHAWSIVTKMRWPSRVVILVHTRVGDRSLHVESNYVQRAKTYGAANKTIKPRFQVDAMRCSNDTENVELCQSRMNVTMGFYERDTSKRKTMVAKSVSLRGRGSSLHKMNEEHACKPGPLARNCTKVLVFVNSGPYTQKLYLNEHGVCRQILLDKRSGLAP
ncbi:hypothetical protein VNO77_41995 [Canavalia gladiata]|uniref:Uncharacterized protein n=1 Tax=Canavalia gladiata TaxID=3824 RepID=A0AAN9PS12_CANGL